MTTPDERRALVGDFNFGSNVLPGVSKLVEECGEVAQVVGKLMSTRGSATHWADGDLRQQLLDEMADVYAAITFVMENTRFNADVFEERVQRKLKIFYEWHDRVDLPPDQPGGQLRGGIEC